MAVGVHRDCDAAVAHPLLYELRICAALETKRRKSVSKVVNADVWQVGLSQV